jgi:GNAT superfamily N-acetyltransferase
MEDHAVFGAYIQGQLIAWIDVGIVRHLQSGCYGEIGGLIVSGKYQRCGIGHLLVEVAEKWTASHDVDRILVRSQIVRKAAHAFYVRQNFTCTKTSAVFVKSLRPELP